MSLLKTPLNLGKISLNNRLVMPPMATAKATEDGLISKEVLDYYDEKSKGGYLGMIIIEHSFITKAGKASDRQMSIAEDTVLEGLKELVDTIHKNGSKAIMQINHAGSGAKSSITGLEVVGPSAIENPRIKSNEIPKELTVVEIKNIIKEFKEAALRVKEAGFDGVEIHSAHSYLLNQFYSPITNKRTDEYGKDLNGRIKFHLEVIKAVREAVGEDFFVALRLGACDYMEGGSTIDDSKFAVKEFEKAGIDLIDISGGLCGYIKPGAKEEGYFSEVTEAIKSVVSIPVILTGGITTAEGAETLLQEGKADLIGVGRVLLNDSDWPKKAIDN